jgi:hypothetical protein
MTVCSLAVSTLLATVLASPVPQQDPPAAPAAAPAASSAAETANPELVSMLTKELGVTPVQAAGGAGALLGLAKTRLKPAEFAQVSAAVPGTDALLKAAPAASVGGIALPAAAAGAAGGAAGLAGLAGAFSKLGLSADSAAKFAPVLLKYVNGKGAAQAAGLLASVLK